jgi:hypothetical protein
MRISLIIILLMGWMPGYTQRDQKQEAWAVLQKMADAYRQSASLNFNIMFRYAAEETPGEWLDSLDGRFTLSGQQYRYDINNTETICTGNYVILLYKEDQVMYLAKPAGVGNSSPSAGFAASVISPAAQMENYLKNDSTIRWNLKDLPHQKKVTIEFTVPAVYKRIEYYINKQSGLLEKMINVVRSDQLYDASVRQAVEAGESFAIVEAVYSGYKQGHADNKLFNSERYFKKEGNEYIAVAPYETYKIFLGSSNL